MPVSGPDVLVVGAGVSGLTTAVCLAETGRRVEIRTDRLPGDTTSAVAGAIWGPHLVETGERAARWRRATLGVLRELATGPDSGATGVRIASGAQVFRASPGPPPDWLTDLGGYRPCRPAELPPGFSSGWRYTAPLAHMPSYLGYLRARFERAGGRLATGRVTSLAGAAREAGAPVVVNCSGAHARQLAGDPAVTPVRGQAVVAVNPGLTEFLIAPSDSSAELAYLFPHRGQIVLGGSEGPGDWNLEPDPAIAERILRDCAAIEPRLRGAQVLAHRVGLRPARPAVRLEAEPAAAGGGPLIVHNYGHGGGGITMSWGCAREAASLAASRG
ncbi:MAG TPA: FAD-dependent oxidoreductase [Streptosporangiaceae bacterium]|nr:FAD-dependent oxidoreductase [Streptosporangiaceae bacterium]